MKFRATSSIDGRPPDYRSVMPKIFGKGSVESHEWLVGCLIDYNQLAAGLQIGVAISMQQRNGEALFAGFLFVFSQHSPAFSCWPDRESLRVIIFLDVHRQTMENGPSSVDSRSCARGTLLLHSHRIIKREAYRSIEQRF